MKDAQKPDHISLNTQLGSPNHRCSSDREPMLEFAERYSKEISGWCWMQRRSRCMKEGPNLRPALPAQQPPNYHKVGRGWRFCVVIFAMMETLASSCRAEG
jgi:hypothetical protein